MIRFDQLEYLTIELGEGEDTVVDGHDWSALDEFMVQPRFDCLYGISIRLPLTMVRQWPSIDPDSSMVEIQNAIDIKFKTELPLLASKKARDSEREILRIYVLETPIE